MSVTQSLLEKWSEENNAVIQRWKEYERRRQPLQDVQKRCYTECLKLHEKVQGVPAEPEQLQLEITVSYNTLLFSLNYCSPNEIKDHIAGSLVRALEAVGSQVSTSELSALWQIVLKTFTGTDYQPWLHKLMLIQWAVWLAECQYDRILHLLLQINPKKEITPSVDLLSETRNLTLSIQEDDCLLVAMVAKELKDLLHICTFISKGVEQMQKKNYMEALLILQEALTQPSPRTLLAHVHLLIGLSYTKLGQAQSALQCYRRALEVDFRCQRALYQSSLVYRQLGNPRAEIEALQLLHSAALLHMRRDSSTTSFLLISPDVLLSSEQMAFIGQIPPPVFILHTLGKQCVLNDRNSEGAEYYLDLLASLQAYSKPQTVQLLTEDSPAFPRVPEIYLEAAFAMLKIKRFWDALAICDELIGKTVDLVPKRLLPDQPLSGPTELAVMNPEPEATEDKMDYVLWSGAAFFLQGLAYVHLKDAKEALTCFTRAINQLMKVCIKQKCWTVKGEGESLENKVEILEAMKGRVLADRGVCFLERGQLKEALRDFQLSLQAFPGNRNSKMWLMEILWRLNRKEEAAALWRQTHNSTESPTSGDMPLYLQTSPEDKTFFCHSNLNTQMEKFIHECDLTENNILGQEMNKEMINLKRQKVSPCFLLALPVLKSKNQN